MNTSTDELAHFSRVFVLIDTLRDFLDELESTCREKGLDLSDRDAREVAEKIISLENGITKSIDRVNQLWEESIY